MGILKARVAGAWVDTAMEGYVRVAGVWVPFAPSPPPTGARIRPAWTPPLQNSPGLYAHGWSFSSSAPVYIPALWWYQPDHSDISAVTTRMYRESDQAILDTVTFPQASIVRAAWNRLPFAAPFLCSASTGYRASVVVSARQSYDNAGGFPHVGGPITVTGDFYNAGGGYPNTSWGGAHGLDIEWVAA